MSLPFLEYALWQLVSLEGGPYFESQYPLQKFKEAGPGSNFAEGKSLGNPYTVLQFLNGKTERCRLDAFFFARHWGEQITDYVDTLKELAKVDETLGRPHVCYFVWGSYFAIDCIVEDVGDIEWGGLRIDQVPRVASVPITLVKWTGSPLVAGAPQGNRETLHIFSRQGTSYEMLAYEKYRNPMLGVLLRRHNRSVKRPYTGAVVKILRRDHPKMKQRIEPTSIAMRKVVREPQFLNAKARERAGIIT